MARRFIPGIARRIADEVVDSVIRNIQQRIDELQGIRILRGKPIDGVELPDATDVPVKHGLGRIARISTSPPYAKTGTPTTGHIRDRTRAMADQFDPAQYLVLRAEDWGTTMYVDLWVY